MQVFNLDGVTPSQNKTDRMHWTKKGDLKDEWYWLVKAAAGVRGEKQEEPVRMHIIRVSKRLIDDSNVPAGCKYLIDAFVKFGHAKDDSHRWMQTTFEQRKCKTGEAPHMEITLAPLRHREETE